MKKIAMLLLVTILAISVVVPAFAVTYCNRAGCHRVVSASTTKQEMTEQSWTLFIYNGYWSWTRTTTIYKCPKGHVYSTSVSDSARTFHPAYTSPDPYIF